ncbi:MAG: diacylglycerol/lipid kinase family protein [Candidatus Acidiferrales bacterium]
MTNQVDLSSIVSCQFPAVVFVNPAAGGGRAGALLPRIRKFFEMHALPVEIVSTTSTGELEARARECIGNGQRLLLAMGGDGTFQGLANAAFGSGILLGILPAGGGNDFAAALGLPENPLAAAEAILSGQPRWVDLVRVRTAEGRERLYVGGGGVGLDAEAAGYASGAYRRLPGRLRYVAAALRALRGFEPLQVRAEFPGSELPSMEARVLLAGALNTPTYGAGLRLAPEAQISDGWIDAVFVDDLNLWGVLKLLPRLMHSGDLRIPEVKRIRAKRVKLTTSRPCMFHGDGEIIGSAPVEIEVVPRAVQVLAPEVS